MAGHRVASARGGGRSSRGRVTGSTAAALDSADRLRDPEKVAPWLYRIAVVTALQYRRRLGRRRKLMERYQTDHADSVARADPDPLDWLLAGEQRQHVQQALFELPPQDAEIMLLKYTEDWSYRELSRHLGLTVSAVEARLHCARERMRRALARLAPDVRTTALAVPARRDCDSGHNRIVAQ